MSAQYFLSQGLTSDDMQGDITLRCLTYVNTKTDTALASLAALPTDVSSFATQLSSLTVNMTKIKGYQYVNVKEYGAVGDGVTNDTTSINNAIAALPASGGILYIPNGKYIISATLMFTNKVHLQIISDNANIFSNAAFNSVQFNTCHYLSIDSKLLISTNSFAANSCGVIFNNSNGVNVSKLVVSGGSGGGYNFGIYIYPTTGSILPAVGVGDSNSTLNNCVVTLCQEGININGEYWTISNCQFIKNVGYGINSSAGNTTVIGCNCIGNSVGMLLDGRSNGNSDHGKIVGTTFNHNNTCGLLIKTVRYGHIIDGCQFWAGTQPIGNIVDNITARSYGYGLYVENVMNLNIVNNEFGHNQYNIGVGGWAQTNLTNNQFRMVNTVNRGNIREFGKTSPFGTNCLINIKNNIMYGSSSIDNGPIITSEIPTDETVYGYITSDNIYDKPLHLYLDGSSTTGKVFDANFESLIINATSGNGWNSDSIFNQAKSIRISQDKRGTSFTLTIYGLTVGGTNRVCISTSTTTTYSPWFSADTSGASYYVPDKALYFGYNGTYHFKPYSTGVNTWIISRSS